MPKKGKGSRNWRQPDFKGHFKADYFDNADYHGGGGDVSRRVSFKKGNRKPHNKGLHHVRDRLLLEDDYNMSGESSGQRNFQRGGMLRHGKGGRSFHPQGKPRLTDQTGWFKVTILGGANQDKQILLGSLRSFVSPVEITPIYYQLEEMNAVFFLDDLQTAEAILGADRRITLTGDSKITIRVVPTTPKVTLSDKLKEKIKLVMVSRFNKDTKALDLSRFHADPELVEETCCAVSRPAVMSIILDVISENIPELQAINLDNNMMFVTEALGNLARKAPNLQVLYLGKNKFNAVNNLNVIKDLNLVELKLEGNPLCQRFDSKIDYQHAVQKLFPKLMRLDGSDLTPAISFELEEKKTKLPEYHSSFLCSDEGRDIVTQFVQQYFALYDAEDPAARQNLIDAYHDSAVFSLTAVYSTNIQTQGRDPPRLNAYISNSRNLKRNSDHEKRDMMLKKGKISIASSLTELPRSQHDPASFTLDLSIFSPVMIVFSLTGVFKEPDVKGTPVRHFFRKFILIPVGAGFSIVNDMLFVTNATQKQLKQSFATAPATATAGASSSSAPSASLASTQMELIQGLSAQSGMNAMWSRKCLEETAWDLQRSMNAFTKLNQEGKIPAEAFVK